MSKFFRKLLCCGVSASSPDAVNTSSTATRESRANRNSQQPQRQSVGNDGVLEVRHININPKPVKKFLKLKTMFSTDDVQYVETRSEETKDYKFNCPICFRYFNKILLSTCCKNYMCHFCANDLNDKVKKDDKVLVARCPFCSSEDFELHDVDPKEKPKKYTDSFYSSFKSNGRNSMFGKDQFQNKLFAQTMNKGQLYNSNVHNDSSPGIQVLKDQRSASDGAAYLQQEVEQQKVMSKTFVEDREYQLSPMKNLSHVIPGSRIERSSVDEYRISRDATEERKSNISDDSINQRAPIEVIQEDEFESSMFPDLDRQQSKDQRAF